MLNSRFHLGFQVNCTRFQLMSDPLYKATEKQKSHKACLTNHTRSISCQWLLMALGADTHTYTHAHIPMHKPKQFQETRHASTCSWHMPDFKNHS